MRYNVGQVLFITLKNQARLIAVRVVEKIDRATLDSDNKTTYMVEDKDKIVSDLENIAGEIFISAKLAEKYLIEQATSSIRKLVGLVEYEAKIFEPAEKKVRPSPTGLEIGRAIAKASLPDVDAVVEKFRQQQLAPVIGEVLEKEGQATVTMPDGSTVRVTM